MSASQRVVVTGLGIVTGNARRLDQFRATLLNATSAIGPLRYTRSDGWPVSEGAEIPPDFLNDRFTEAERRAFTRDQQMALAPVGEALRMSGLVERSDIRRRTAVVMGCVQYFGRNRLAAILADEFELGHPQIVVDAACSAGAHALGLAYSLVRRDTTRVALAAGFNTLLLKDVAGLFKVGILARWGALRPFDRNRTGTYAGEGSAAIVLESREHALGRGAPIYAEICGYGGGADAHEIVPPHREGRGLRVAMENALRDAAITQDQVDYVNAHGTGTKLNDPCETAAIRAALGSAAYRIPVSSTKPITGHTLGAAGIVEAIATMIAVHGDFVPPTLNHEQPDAACDLDYVPGNARRMRVDVAVSNSSGFGGVYSTLVFRKHGARAA